MNAMAGATVLRDFDPVDAIAGVCEQGGLRLHIDASWGGWWRSQCRIFRD